LTWEPSADEINIFEFCDCFDVSVPFDLRPMLFKDFDAVRVVLDLPLTSPFCTFKAKV
jgi:hypothetical protein